jgi:hypothetical protein
MGVFVVNGRETDQSIHTDLAQPDRHDADAGERKEGGNEAGHLRRWIEVTKPDAVVVLLLV